jgi:hypothetical protein
LRQNGGKRQDEEQGEGIMPLITAPLWRDEKKGVVGMGENK